MENSILVENESVPLVAYHDNDPGDDNKYNHHNTTNTSSVDETIFTTPSSTNEKATFTSLKKTIK